MRVSVVLPPQPRWHGSDGAEQRWRRVEELGFDHAWTYDHLSWQSLVDQSWFATVPVLAAAALATTTITARDLGGLTELPPSGAPSPRS